jgi:hypothetical protein
LDHAWGGRGALVVSPLSLRALPDTLPKVLIDALAKTCCSNKVLSCGESELLVGYLLETGAGAKGGSIGLQT